MFEGDGSCINDGEWDRGRGLAVQYLGRDSRERKTGKGKFWWTDIPEKKRGEKANHLFKDHYGGEAFRERKSISQSNPGEKE